MNSKKIEILEKRREIVNRVFEINPELKDSYAIRPIQNELRLYLKNNPLISEEDKQIIHSLLVSNAYLLELFPEKHT